MDGGWRNLGVMIRDWGTEGERNAAYFDVT